MDEEANDQQRLENEILLLQAAYQGQITYNQHSHELKFISDDHSTFILRIPEDYPSSSLPEILAATGPAKHDFREQLRKQIQHLHAGDEVLDVIINTFQDLVTSGVNHKPAIVQEPTHGTEKEQYLTVIIWLHHLLATSKRKLAIAPSNTIAGLTKPGYPGVMLFSGPSRAVKDHVETLKQENWQAFQVRLEQNEEWVFAHGKGIKEVESMSEAVKEVGEAKKEVFLQAIGIK